MSPANVEIVMPVEMVACFLGADAVEKVTPLRPLPKNAVDREHSFVASRMLVEIAPHQMDAFLDILHEWTSTVDSQRWRQLDRQVTEAFTDAGWIGTTA